MALEIEIKKYVTDEQIMKLISIAHSKIIRIKGNEYAPTSKEIQEQIDIILCSMTGEPIKPKRNEIALDGLRKIHNSS